MDITGCASDYYVLSRRRCLRSLEKTETDPVQNEILKSREACVEGRECYRIPIEEYDVCDIDSVPDMSIRSPALKSTGTKRLR